MSEILYKINPDRNVPWNDLPPLPIKEELYENIDIYKNIVFENRVTVFADYLGHFGNIDIDWQMQLDMTINEYVRANVGIHMIYDDDIKAKKEIDGQQVTVGPRLQLKQMLGVGMVYQF